MNTLNVYNSSNKLPPLPSIYNPMLLNTTNVVTKNTNSTADQQTTRLMSRNRIDTHSTFVRLLQSPDKEVYANPLESANSTIDENKIKIKNLINQKE